MRILVLARNIMIRGFWRSIISIIKFAGRLALKT
jgi:hypothetical protein